MYACLSISEDIAWLPRVAALDLSLRYIISNLDPVADAELIDELDTQAYSGFGGVEPEQFQRFAEVARRTFFTQFRRWLHDGDKEIFLFWVLFSQFSALLVLHPDYPSYEPREGRIRLSKDVIWEAEAWVYEFVMNVLLSWLKGNRGEAVVEQMMNCWKQEEYLTDLSMFSESVFREIYPAIEYLDSESAYDNVSLDSVLFIEPIKARTAQLHEIFRSDSRH